MRLMTLQQYMNMSKPALIRKIMKTLRAMPKAKLARLCYNITKSKLPRLYRERSKVYRRTLATMKPIGIRDKSGRKLRVTRIGKRKFSRKQLAAQRLFAKRARAGTLKRRRR